MKPGLRARSVERDASRAYIQVELARAGNSALLAELRGGTLASFLRQQCDPKSGPEEQEGERFGGAGVVRRADIGRGHHKRSRSTVPRRVVIVKIAREREEPGLMRVISQPGVPLDLEQSAGG